MVVRQPLPFETLSKYNSSGDPLTYLVPPGAAIVMTLLHHNSASKIPTTNQGLSYLVEGEEDLSVRYGGGQK